MDEAARQTGSVDGADVLAVTSLVAAWSEKDQTHRSDFSIKLYEMAARLSVDERLVIRIQSDSSNTLGLMFAITRADGTPSSGMLGLQHLLGEPDSPVLVRPAAQPAQLPVEPGHRYVIRRFVFSADTPSRRRPLALDYNPAVNLRGLCAALLDQVSSSLELTVAPVEAKYRSLEEVFREASGPQSTIPETIGQALRDGGNFVQASLVLTSVAAPSARLLSEISAISRPVEIIQWAEGQLPPSEVVGTRTLAAMFRIPVAHSASFPGFAVSSAPVIRAPQAVCAGEQDDGLRLGRASDARGVSVDVHLPLADFSRHIYVPGQTGAGKSTILRSMACEVARSGHGMLFIDPHGDAARQLLRELPAERVRDVHFVNAADLEAPAPINPFSVTDLLQRDTALANVTAMFQDLFDPTQQGIVGPRWESWFRMGMLTLIAARGRHASILDVPRLFMDNAFMKKQRDTVVDEYLVDFWDQEMAQTNAHTRSEILGWFTSKFTAFRTNAVLRAVLGSGRDMLEASDVMDQGKIIVVSLQKGEIGAPIAQLLGYLYLTRYWTAALKRKTARPFALFVDEAQTFSRGALADILAEGRKFGLYAVLANQYLEQLPEQLQHALLGNVGTLVAFRMGDRDADQFAGRLGPEFSAESLRRLPNHQAACSLLLDGAIQPAFSLDGDHIERLASRSDRQMTDQAESIIKASQSYFRRSEEMQLPTGSANSTGPASMPGRPPDARPSVGATFTQANIPSFVEALRQKRNGRPGGTS
ncbi:type IV secretory system conjugative DNA transfer family protein [Amycolatopsis sp. NPDC049252]|uniref:type IV secretory system conjugative DNA transfer family protein n=1 Tax=Amycolatopsis sp. NPDC049252 TaxID=3363933 RepID=UPI00371147AA